MHVELVTVFVVVVVFGILSARCSFFILLYCFIVFFCTRLILLANWQRFTKVSHFYADFSNRERGGVARPTYSCSSWNWSQIRCCCNLYEVWAWQWWPPTNDIVSDLACVLICTRISKAFEVRSFAWLSLSCVPNKSKLHWSHYTLITDRVLYDLLGFSSSRSNFIIVKH